MTDRWFLGLPFVGPFLGQQAYCQLYTCRKTKWWHDGSNPASLLWGAFKFFLENHKENCKRLQHPHHKHVYLNQSRPESPRRAVSEPLQRRLQLPSLMPAPLPPPGPTSPVFTSLMVPHYTFCISWGARPLGASKYFAQIISFNPH